MRTTTAIESLLSTVRQRTDHMDTLPTETSCLTMVWAVMEASRFPKIPVGSRRKSDRSRHTSNQPKGWFGERVFADMPVSAQVASSKRKMVDYRQ